MHVVMLIAPAFHKVKMIPYLTNHKASFFSCQAVDNGLRCKETSTLVFNIKKCLHGPVSSIVGLTIALNIIIKKVSLLMNPIIISLQNQIMLNCRISDGRYGGVFSLCVFLLRMRYYYKWEVDLDPWEEPDYQDLLQWVESKETLWEETAVQELSPLNIGRDEFDPFDVDAINARLQGFGLFYGAGYATGMKPTFFLAAASTRKIANNMQVHTLNQELARDLFTSPAMRQGSHIITRPRTMAALLWDMILEKKPSTLPALKFALSRYGLDLEELERSPGQYSAALWQIAGDESETWVYHELGEAMQEGFDLEIWQEMISTHANTAVEKVARAAKDLLADTHEQGLLAHIIEHQKASSLGLYLCLAEPLARSLFPEIKPAFDRIKSGQGWGLLEETRQAGYLRAKDLAGQLAGLHLEGRHKGRDWMQSQVDKLFIRPLGLGLADDPGP